MPVPGAARLGDFGVEDLGLEALEFRRGLQARFAPEDAVEALVGLQGLASATGAALPSSRWSRTGSPSAKQVAFGMIVRVAAASVTVVRP